jgi:N-acyl-D-aspartate/D-glutamate deacylase
MESLSGVCVSFGLAGLGHANLPSGEPGFNPCVAPIILEIRARGENIIRFAGAVKEMTSLPAEKSGIIGGYFADIVVFNPDMVIGRATFKDPQRPSSVILSAVVNGRIVANDGEHTGASPQKVLRASGQTDE